MTGGLLHRTTDEVEDLGGDLLLTALVIFKSEFLKEVVAAVGGELHSYGAGGVLGGVVSPLLIANSLDNQHLLDMGMSLVNNPQDCILQTLCSPISTTMASTVRKSRCT